MNKDIAINTYLIIGIIAFILVIIYRAHKDIKECGTLKIGENEVGSVKEWVLFLLIFPFWAFIVFCFVVPTWPVLILVSLSDE